MSKTALFTNFSNEEFIGYWDGKPKKFQPGQSLYMPDYLAQHFAKHLTNRELIKKGLETATSPKKPDQVPEFMELFNRAYTPDETDEMEEKADDIDTEIAVANKNRTKTEHSGKQDPTKPQTVLPPDDDEDEESEFGGKPNEEQI
jgi:uncharacterized protein with von Willebrand factor type A (vWA) domain